MIIKSMSRKTASFRNLIEYLHKDGHRDRGVYTRNLIRNDPDGAAHEMEANAKLLPSRRNGNILYHEIISLPENSVVPLRRQASMLEDLVDQYVKRRCPENLVYGKLHKDRAHLHMHLVISSNCVRSRKRHWLPKSELRHIQQEIEAYQISKYPQLGTEKFYDDKARAAKQRREVDQPILKDREKALKKRTGNPSRKERDHQTIKEIFACVKNEPELAKKLREGGFSLYVRGKSEGVIANDGRKYRLRTLGLEPALQTARARIQTFVDRQQQLNEHTRAPSTNIRERL